MNTVLKILLFYFTALSFVSATIQESATLKFSSKADCYLNTPAKNLSSLVAECTFFETNETENSECGNKAIDLSNLCYSFNSFFGDTNKNFNRISVYKYNPNSFSQTPPFYILYHSLKIPFSC